MKITAEMSQRKKKECLNDVAIKASHFGAVLAGGYVRDYIFNQVPKDIDLFIHFRRPFNGNFNVEELKRITASLLAAYGQEVGPNEHLQHYGDNGNVVIKSAGASDDYEAIDVIFHEEFNPINGFDLNCCKVKANVGNGNRVTIHRSHDFDVVYHRGYEAFFNWTPAEYIEHYKRIKDKVPGIGVRYSFESFGASAPHLNYNLLIREGLIEDPRQVFPQEAIQPNRDEVRLDIGVGAREAIVRAREAFIGMANEARANPVHDQARVQPRLQGQGIIDEWAAINNWNIVPNRG